jgi:hypothetical protein
MSQNICTESHTAVMHVLKPTAAIFITVPIIRYGVSINSPHDKSFSILFVLGSLSATVTPAAAKEICMFYINDFLSYSSQQRGSGHIVLTNISLAWTTQMTYFDVRPISFPHK